MKIFYSLDRLRPLSVLIVVCSFLLFHFALLRSGFPMTHDGTHHLIRAAHYFQLLKDGQILPYWDGYMNSGFGSPLFNYVPPLTYIVSSFFRYIQFSTSTSLKLVIILFNALFFTGSFKALRLFFSSKVALLASVVLFFSPYRIGQVFVRGAVPEFVALSLTPLFLYFFVQSLQSKQLSKYFLLSVLMLGLIFLAHTLFALQLSMLMAIILFIF